MAQDNPAERRRARGNKFLTALAASFDHDRLDFVANDFGGRDVTRSRAPTDLSRVLSRVESHRFCNQSISRPRGTGDILHFDFDAFGLDFPNAGKRPLAIEARANRDDLLASSKNSRSTRQNVLINSPKTTRSSLLRAPALLYRATLPA